MITLYDNKQPKEDWRIEWLKDFEYNNQGEHDSLISKVYKINIIVERKV